MLKVLGADVRPVPAVPYDDQNNYNHQVWLRHYLVYLSTVLR
jgi:hypothetical protein